ncbi:MAG: class I tRNA ligase family protein, partial [Oscillospiraceae bacterium]
ILVNGDNYSKELESKIHKAIKKVSNDIENLKFNTAIATMMALTNDIYAKGEINKTEMKAFIQMLNPFAPHITEQMWENCGFKGMLNEQSWILYDEEKCQDKEIEIAVQVNGKIKDRIIVSADEDEQSVLDKAKGNDKVAVSLEGKQIVKQLYIKGKLVNIVIK